MSTVTAGAVFTRRQLTSGECRNGADPRASAGAIEVAGSADRDGLSGLPQPRRFSTGMPVGSMGM